MNVYLHSMKHLSLLCLFYILISGWQLNAQGSSDPGLSTAGSLGIMNAGIASDTAQKRNLMRITQSVARGNDDVFIVTSYLDVYLQINPRIQFQIRGPIHMARTKDARAVSIGDIFLIYSYKALQKERHQLMANAGVKLPTNQANLVYDNVVLPMSYQTSTGSFEAILSMEYIWQQRLGVLSAAAGYQQPFFYINQNSLAETRQLHRKSDVMLMADYLFGIGKKFHAGAGVWWMYHTADDTRLNVNDQRERIIGSKGSTFNLTASALWQPVSNIELGCAVGIPVVNRDVLPDGLYRQFVLNPYFQLRF